MISSSLFILIQEHIPRWWVSRQRHHAKANSRASARNSLLHRLQGLLRSVNLAVGNVVEPPPPIHAEGAPSISDSMKSGAAHRARHRLGRRFRHSFHLQDGTEKRIPFTDPPREVTIVLADDHTQTRKSIRELLAQMPVVSVVGEAGSASQAVDLVRLKKPDVLLIDIDRYQHAAVTAIRLIVEKRPGTRVIAMSMHASDYIGRNVLGAGARGYVLKDQLSEEIYAALKVVLNGGVYISPSVHTGNVD